MIDYWYPDRYDTRNDKLLQFLELNIWYLERCDAQDE